VPGRGAQARHRGQAKVLAAMTLVGLPPRCPPPLFGLANPTPSSWAQRQDKRGAQIDTVPAVMSCAVVANFKSRLPLTLDQPSGRALSARWSSQGLSCQHLDGYHLVATLCPRKACPRERERQRACLVGRFAYVELPKRFADSRTD